MPARQPAGTVANLHIARNRRQFRIGEMPHQLANRVRLDFRIGIDGYDEIRLRFGDCPGQRGGLATIHLMNDLHTRVVAEVRIQQCSGVVR